MTPKLGPDEQAIMDYLHEHVFDPILTSARASQKLKGGVNLTITRMRLLKAEKMVEYYWNAIKGTERSKGFAALMKKERFNRFEETIDEFRERFDPKILRKAARERTPS